MTDKLNVLERYFNDCFETNSIDMFKMAKKGETVKLKNLYDNNKITFHDLC